MAQLDPNIILQGRAPQMPDPLHAQQEALTIQAMRQRGQMMDMQMQAQRKQSNDQSQIQQIMGDQQNYTTDQYGVRQLSDEAITKITGINAELGMGVQKNQLQQREAVIKMQQATQQMTNQEMAVAGHRMALYGDVATGAYMAYQNVKNQTGNEEAAQKAGQQALSQGLDQLHMMGGIDDNSYSQFKKTPFNVNQVYSMASGFSTNYKIIASEAQKRQQMQMNQANKDREFGLKEEKFKTGEADKNRSYNLREQQVLAGQSNKDREFTLKQAQETNREKLTGSEVQRNDAQTAHLNQLRTNESMRASGTLPPMARAPSTQKNPKGAPGAPATNKAPTTRKIDGKTYQWDAQKGWVPPQLPKQQAQGGGGESGWDKIVHGAENLGSNVAGIFKGREKPNTQNTPLQVGGKTVKSTATDQATKEKVVIFSDGSQVWASGPNKGKPYTK